MCLKLKPQCCEDDSILDLYRGQQDTQSNACSTWPGGGLFRRVTSNKPATTEWFITPSNPIVSTQFGVSVAGQTERVWAVETRQNGRFASRYNIETQSQEAAISGMTSTRSGDWLEAASQTHYAIVQYVNLQFDSHRLEVFTGTSRTLNFFRIIDPQDQINKLALRYWPKGAGSYDLIAGSQFFIFDGLEVQGAPPNGKLVPLNKQTVYQPGTGSNALFRGWQSFDQTSDGWAGVAAFTSDNGNTEHRVLLINGQFIDDMTFPAPVAGGEIESPITVHVSHPHETIGPVVCVVRTRISDHKQRFETYTMAGVKLYESPYLPNGLSCRHSSDRWLYVGTARLNVQDMPGTVLEPTTNGSFHWMLRHDGSESVPLNSLMLGGNWLDVVRNSKKFENVPPLDNFMGRACENPAPRQT